MSTDEHIVTDTEEESQTTDDASDASAKREIRRKRYNAFKEANPGFKHFVKPPSQSDMATALIRHLKNRFAFRHGDKNWYVWTGSHWEVDKRNITLNQIHAYLVKSVWEGISYTFTEYVQKTLAIYLQLPEQENPGLIPFKNCVLSLESRKTLKHDPDMGFTWSLPYNYEPSADCPSFKAWLNFTQYDEKDKVEVLRAFLNAFVTGRNDLEKILELIGLAGAGKSTYITIATRLVGKENTTSTDLKKLEESQFETANLFNKKIAVISDSSKYGGPVEMLKRLTGRDPVPLEVKNKQKHGDFVFGGMVLLAANEQPRSNDYTSGIGRRAVRIDFKRRVAAKDRDPRLAEKLCKELPGILNWCLALSHDEVTQILLGATAERARLLALIESNPIAAWMNDRLIYEEGCDTQVGDGKSDPPLLYGDFLSWCEATGSKPVKLQSFSSTIVDLSQYEGFDVRKETNKTRNTKVLTNVRLRGEHEILPPFLIDEDEFNPDREPPPNSDKPETSGDSPEAGSPNSGDFGDSGGLLYNLKENIYKKEKKSEKHAIYENVYETPPESPSSPDSGGLPPERYSVGLRNSHTKNKNSESGKRESDSSSSQKVFNKNPCVDCCYFETIHKGEPRGVGKCNARTDLEGKEISGIVVKPYCLSYHPIDDESQG